MDVNQLGNGETGSKSDGFIRVATPDGFQIISQFTKKYGVEKRKRGIDWEHRKKVQKEWQQNNKAHRSQYSNSYYHSHKESRLDDAKRYRESRTPEQIEQAKAYQKKYRAENAEKKKQQMAEWVAKNKDYLAQKNKEYLPRRLAINKLRRATDPVQRLKDACRTRVGFILKKAGIPKFDHTFELVGCTPDFFRAHLEKQFEPWMNWENFGEWEIDHIKALSKFNLADHDQRLAAFHYSNCQPLRKIVNRMKGNR